MFFRKEGMKKTAKIDRIRIVDSQSERKSHLKKKEERERRTSKRSTS